MDPAEAHALDPPASVGVGVTPYRLWIHTSDDDPGGPKGEVNICLHGALGSVWLEQLQASRPTAGELFRGSTSKDGRGDAAKVRGPAGQRCEIYVAAQEVGTLHRLTVAYAHGDGDGKCKPWRLRQVVVRHGSDGSVTAFPAVCELKGPKALLELHPQLTWHEDMYGNCSEGPPPLPPSGQWIWPAAVSSGGRDALRDSSGQDALQLAIYRAVCEEEIMPLIDGALSDLALQRTPGSFLYQCVQAAAGSAAAAARPGSMDELRRTNLELTAKVKKLSNTGSSAATNREDQLRIEMNQLRAEKERLELKTREQQELILEQHSRSERRAQASAFCLLS